MLIEKILDQLFYQKEEDSTELEHACDRYWRATSSEEQQNAVDDIKRLLGRGEL